MTYYDPGLQSCIRHFLRVTVRLSLIVTQTTKSSLLTEVVDVAIITTRHLLSLETDGAILPLTPTVYVFLNDSCAAT